MFKIVIIWYLLASAVTFIVFVVDKSRAARGLRRIPEKTLHTFELVGGWPGALAAISAVRHKNRKLPFLAVTGLIAVVHIGLWIVALRGRI